ncbi:MAG: NAD(P)/FAD-dependent oxidoreductase, partial [Planctomyces sp.]
MPLRVTNLRTPVELPETQLPDELARVFEVRRDDVPAVRILRKSLDARNRQRLEFVYTLALGDDHSAHALKSRHGVTVEAWQPTDFQEPESGHEPLPRRPVIVGSGPAGLLAGYFLALRGYKPLIIERGQAVKERVPAIREFDGGGVHDEENNYLFGEGGAGCFSDGKLTCRITGPDVDWVLRSFVECGGRPSLVYEHRPHLGSNKLPMICRNYRRRIEALGGQYQFGCRLEGLDVRDGQLRGLQTSSGYIPASVCVLAIGHSARDTYEMLLQTGLPLLQKAFMRGLRIEHPQDLVNQ